MTKGGNPSQWQKKEETPHNDKKRRKPLTNDKLNYSHKPIKMKQPAIYIMANKPNGTIYVGVTSNLIQRIFQHKNNLCEGFTKKYNCKSLVYYEIFDDMESAISREKQIKSSSRDKKIMMIESMNKKWDDLYGLICGWALYGTTSRHCEERSDAAIHQQTRSRKLKNGSPRYARDDELKSPQCRIKSLQWLLPPSLRGA